MPAPMFDGGCCGGNFPEPEVDKKKKEEKVCCHGGCVQCNCGTGCGPGPVKEGSVQDASGASVLSQKKETYAKAEFLLVTSDGEYLFDLNDERHNSNEIQVLAKLVTGWGILAGRNQVTIFGLKRNECSYRYHKLRLDTIKRIVSWNLEKWKEETSEGIV